MTDNYVIFKIILFVKFYSSLTMTLVKDEMRKCLEVVRISASIPNDSLEANISMSRGRAFRHVIV